MTALLPIVIIIFIGIVLYVARIKARPIFRVNKKWTYRLFIGYAFILLLATFIVAVMDTKIGASLPDKIAVEKIYDMDRSLEKGELSSVDPSHISSEHTYEVKESLRISSLNFYSPNNVYLERKPTNDGLVEMTVLKPVLVVNDRDFSKRMPINKLQWTSDPTTGSARLLISEQPTTQINIMSFKDAFMLRQFTEHPRQFSSFESTLNKGVDIYLRVPKKLLVQGEDYIDIIYVDK